MVKALKLLCFAGLLFLCSCASSQSPVSIILETDIGPDCDDAGAVALLLALAYRGECNILAMWCNSSSPWGAPCLDAINTYYGRLDIPIGTWKGSQQPDQHFDDFANFF